MHPFSNEVISIYNSLFDKDYVDKENVIELKNNVKLFFLKEDNKRCNPMDEVKDLLLATYEERVFNKK